MATTYTALSLDGSCPNSEANMSMGLGHFQADGKSEDRGSHRISSLSSSKLHSDDSPLRTVDVVEGMPKI
jgi:hypothetical protein